MAVIAQFALVEHQGGRFIDQRWLGRRHRFGRREQLRPGAGGEPVEGSLLANRIRRPQFAVKSQPSEFLKTDRPKRLTDELVMPEQFHDEPLELPRCKSSQDRTKLYHKKAARKMKKRFLNEVLASHLYTRGYTTASR
jgi:hypothetical protein